MDLAAKSALLQDTLQDLGSLLVAYSGGTDSAYLAFAAWPRPQIDASFGALIAAGLLVGIGTRYGAGCTSGHGVCGIARLSPRSLVATLIFMAAGFATVLVTRHLAGV